MSKALCASMPASADVFFSTLPHEMAVAKNVCRACPVQQACLDTSLYQDEVYGIWGGIASRQRTPLRRAMGARAQKIQGNHIYAASSRQAS